MPTPPGRIGLGTLLRHTVEVLDGDVAKIYLDLGITDYRPRFSPVVRAVVAAGPMSIRELADAIPVTHSAASQTVAQMARSGLVELRTGTDARERIVHLTEKCRALLPTIQAEWTATEMAADALEAELPLPLRTVLTAALDAVAKLPMHDRIVAAAEALDDPALRLPTGGNQ